MRIEFDRAEGTILMAALMEYRVGETLPLLRDRALDLAVRAELAMSRDEQKVRLADRVRAHLVERENKGA